MNESKSERPARAALSGQQPGFAIARPRAVKPPILVLKNDNTRLHAFDTVDQFVDHEQGESFDIRGWDVFDSVGTKLEVLEGESGLAGLKASASQTSPARLMTRMHQVMDIVEDKVEQNPPAPELGIDGSILAELRELHYDKLLDELTDLFWRFDQQEEASGVSMQPSISQFRGSRIRRRRTGRPSGATLAGGSGSQQNGGPSASDSIVARPDPASHSRGWWHNTWGH